MIALFTDFGSGGPYVGQVHGVLARDAPGVPIIDLFHEVPRYDIRAAAYLLPAYAAVFPQDTVFVCVVDPGVGGARRPLYVVADGRRFVGPDNGLFSLVMRRAARCEVHEILWRPPVLSTSFHGRDLFAPVAAMLAQGRPPANRRLALVPPGTNEWPDDLTQVLYIDGYGNGITGLRASQLPIHTDLRLGTHSISYARVYEEAVAGCPFWYENANGLVEIAVSRGSAQRVLGLAPGDRFTTVPAASARAPRD